MSVLGWCIRCGRPERSFAEATCACEDPVFSSEPQQAGGVTLPKYVAEQPAPKRPVKISMGVPAYRAGDWLNVGGRQLLIESVELDAGRGLGRLICVDNAMQKVIVPYLVGAMATALDREIMTSTRSTMGIVAGLHPAAGTMGDFSGVIPYLRRTGIIG